MKDAYKYCVGECFKAGGKIYVIEGINYIINNYRIKEMSERKKENSSAYYVPKEIIDAFEPLLGYVDKEL